MRRWIGILVTIVVAGCGGAAPQPTASPSPSPGVAASPSAAGVMEAPNGDLAPRSDPADQTVARGTVQGSDLKPRAGALVFLAMDPAESSIASMRVGDVLAQKTVVWAESDAAGHFELHLRPTDAIRAVASQNGGFVNFEVQAFSPYPPTGASSIGMWHFPLTLSGAMFSGMPDPFTVALQP